MLLRIGKACLEVGPILMTIALVRNASTSTLIIYGVIMIIVGSLITTNIHDNSLYSIDEMEEV